MSYRQRKNSHLGISFSRLYWNCDAKSSLKRQSTYLLPFKDMPQWNVSSSLKLKNAKINDQDQKKLRKQWFGRKSLKIFCLVDVIGRTWKKTCLSKQVKNVLYYHA